jgi:hypothetical protein
MKAALFTVLAVALVAAGGGYALGHSSAPDGADAGQARTVSARTATAGAFAAAAADGRRTGLQAGEPVGHRAAAADGAQRGRTAGESAARARRAEIQAAQAQAAQAAAQAQAARAAAQAQPTASNTPTTGGCNVPLFQSGYCPTPAEIQRENLAENLCGGGTAAGREEAAKLGIQC